MLEGLLGCFFNANKEKLEFTCISKLNIQTSSSKSIDWGVLGDSE